MTAGSDHPVTSGGTVVLPPLTGRLDALWDLILDLAERVPAQRWELIGGQMVLLHGLRGGRGGVRVSQDVDVLADLLNASDGLRRCVRAVRSLHLDPVPDSRGRVYRFQRASDQMAADVLAPDHSPPRWPLHTVGSAETIQVPGGRQALQRLMVVTVVKGGRSVEVPVPDLLGALVLKAAAWVADSRDRDRHSGDAAFLASLMADPRAERARLAGSDRKRLRRLDRQLGDPKASEWLALGDHAADGYAAWRLLVS